MKGARALGSAALVLAVICLVPAVSAAQNEAPPKETTTTTPSEGPADPAALPGPAPAEAPSAKPTTPKQEGGNEPDSSPQRQAATEPITVEQGDTSGGGRSDRRARASATAVVTMGDFFFSPATVSVAVGDIVTWRNTGKEPHNAVADDGSFDTGTVAAGQRASRMFDKPGTFTYICTIHPQMKGTVRVQGGGGGGGGGSAGGSSGTGPTEAQAVASPEAAGDSNTLPMSGMAAGALAIVGFALLSSGLLVGLWGRKAEIGRQLTLF